MTTSTLTSKGQVTLPAEIRRQMHLKEGDRLVASYDAQTQTLSFTKPLTLEQLAGKYGKLIKPGTKPLTDVDTYFQKHREVRL